MSALPVLGALVAQAGATLRRFPFVLGAAVVAAGAGIAIVNHQGETPENLQRLLATGVLGLPLFTALALTAERRAGRLFRLGAGVLGVAVLAAWYGAWPGSTDDQRLYHFIELLVAFHLLAAVLPFARRSLERAFWQYNRVLLQRFLLAAVFSVVIYLGLALALAAVNKLLGVDLEPQAYGRVWFVVAFVVNTWIFLAGVPADLDALEHRRDYPPALKVLAQRILVPLVSLYVVILGLYLVRIIVTRHWPSGWVGWLVSALGVTGTLALLLVHPIAQEKSEGWIGRFTRGYWIAVLPSVMMLWLAIGQRVNQYGVTEPRYFLTVLSLWLFGVALFYTLRRAGDIRVIPGSLAVVSLLTLGGPWGAAAVSRVSQLHRLSALLAKSGVLEEGQIHAHASPVPSSDRKEIVAVVNYLVRTHGPGVVKQWFAERGMAVDSEVGLRNGWNAGDRVATRLGVAHPAGTGAASFDAADGAPLAVAGYTLLIRRVAFDRSTTDTGFTAVYVRRTGTVIVYHAATPLVEIAVDSATRAGRAQASRPDRRPLEVRGRGAGWEALLRIRGFYGADSSGLPASLDGEVLLKSDRNPGRDR